MNSYTSPHQTASPHRIPSRSPSAFLQNIFFLYILVCPMGQLGILKCRHLVFCFYCFYLGILNIWMELQVNIREYMGCCIVMERTVRKLNGLYWNSQ